MATLKDVAREANLSVTTVSRVLNNRGYISEQTREKVYAVMDELNYQPNELARSLGKKMSNTIGLIVPHISHPYFAELISNIENEVSKHGYKLLLCSTKGRKEKEKEYLEMCKSNMVIGVILCSGSVLIEDFLELNIPVIAVERALAGGVASVECDNQDGGRLAARKLIEAGCKRLLHISGVTDFLMPADERANGFIDVCEEHGISHIEVPTSSDDYNSSDYYDFIADTLACHEGIDGIFASSDVIAAQVLKYCKKNEIMVPDDVKVIGFDDVKMALLTAPMLSTIHQPIKEMAKTAVQLLLQYTNGSVVPKRSILPVHFVDRETV